MQMKPYNIMQMNTLFAHSTLVNKCLIAVLRYRVHIIYELLDETEVCACFSEFIWKLQVSRAIFGPHGGGGDGEGHESVIAIRKFRRSSEPGVTEIRERRLDTSNYLRISCDGDIA